MLPNVAGWQLAGLQRSRELADYDATTSFPKVDVQAMLVLVDNLFADANAILGREGMLP